MQLKKKVTDAQTVQTRLFWCLPHLVSLSEVTRPAVLTWTWRITAKLLCGLEASQGTVEEVLSSATNVKADDLDSNEDLDPDEDGENERKGGRKKKNKRRKGIKFCFFLSMHKFNEGESSGCWFECFDVVFTESSESSDGNEYPLDVWLVLSSYIRPEDVCRFALICRSAWTATCTAAFWTRLYRRWSGHWD